MLKKLLKKIGIIKEKPWYKKLLGFVFLKKLNKKKKLLLFVILIVLLIVLYFLLFTSGAAKADWWSTDWHYRKAITITNSGSAQTNFQVQVTVDTSNTDKFQGSCEDIRFTNQSGNELNYWIESGCGTATTDIWVKIDSIPVGDSIIYMYYGNDLASSKSVYTKVFDKIGKAGSVTVGGTEVNIDGYEFSDPLVFASPVGVDNSRTGTSATQHQLITNVSSSGFNIKQTEPSTGGDGVVDVSGINYLILEQGTYYLGTSTLIEVGAQEIGDAYETINFDNTFVNPTIFAETQTANSDEDVYARADYFTTNSATVQVEEGAGTPSVDETVAYLVVEQGLEASENWEAALSPNEVTHNYSSYNFSNSYSDSPIAIAFDTTEDGGDNSYSVIGNISTTQIQLAIEETAPEDGAHTSEEVAWLSVPEGLIYGRQYAPNEPLAGSPSTEELSPGPVGYWSFDNGYGSVAQDRTSNNNDGTITGATWQSEDMCMSGKCLYFDGDDYVDTNFGSGRNMTNNPLSVSMWVKPITSSDRMFLATTNGTGQRFYFATKDDDWEMGIQSSGWSGGVDSVEYNKWTHISIVADGSNVKLYVNGSYSYQKSYTSYSLASDIAIGSQGPGGAYRWLGYIDEVRFYDYARTEDQILADYNAGRSGGSASTLSSGGGSSNIHSSTNLSDGLVGYWKMDESSWNGTSGEVVDSSGNDNDGTGNGGVTTDAGKYSNGGNFDGTDDYISVTDAETLDLTDDLTLSAWVKVDSPEPLSIINKFGSGYSGYRFGINSSDSVVLQYGNSSGSLETIAKNTNLLDGYNLITITKNYNDVLIYLNGKEIYKKKVNDNIIGINTRPLHIGRNSWNSEWYSGNIDEVRIYNRALSEREVSDLYNWAPGPTAYYNFEESSGTTVYDKSGNGYNSSTFGGDPSWELGKYGFSLNFDTNDYVRNNNFFIDEDPIFTVSGWFKRKGSMNGTGAWGIGAGGTSQKTISGYSNQGNNIGIDLWGTSTYYVDHEYPLNDWVHVAWVKNAKDFNTNTIKIYVNGANKDLSVSRDGSDLVDLSSGFTSGAIYASSSYNAPVAIDEFKIYNYARSQKQIIEDMNAGHPAQTSPIAYWKFDEGYGSTTVDSGIGGNDGSITGATWTNAGKFGKALIFDGNSDYVNYGSVDQFESFSLGAWLYPTSIPSYDSDSYFYAQSGNAYLRFSLSETSLSSNVRWRFPDTSYTTYILSDSNSINEWAYINITYDGVNNILKGYKNGELQYAYDDVDIYSDFGGTIEVGRNQVNSAYYNGKIDELKIYNYALTEDEIKNEYNRGQTAVMGQSGGDGAGGISQSNLGNYCVPGSNETCSPPIAEWNFEEYTGLNIYDSSGNGNTGTLINMEEEDWTPGKIGGGLKFDGSDEYVSVSSPTVGANDLTVSFWMKPSELNQETVLGYNSTYTRMIQIQDNNTIEFNLGEAGVHNYYDIVTNFQTNIWQHVTITKTSTGDVGVYLNGKDVILGSSTINNAVDINWNRIGREKTTNLIFSGTLDQIRIYDYVRSPAQIAWDYNKGKPVGWWKMDECQGETVIDRSGNGNDGTIDLGSSGQTTLGTCEDGTGAWGNGKTGKINASLNFDGGDDWVDCGDDSNIDLSEFSAYSISAWAKLDAKGSDRVITSKGDANTGLIWYDIVDDDWKAHASGAYAMWQKESPVIGKWYHIVNVWDGNEFSIWVNGTKGDNTGSISNLNDSTADPLLIGTRGSVTSPNSLFDGQIDDVRIYNYALTESQVQSVYNNGSIQIGSGE